MYGRGVVLRSDQGASMHKPARWAASRHAHGGWPLQGCERRHRPAHRGAGLALLAGVLLGRQDDADAIRAQADVGAALVEAPLGGVRRHLRSAGRPVRAGRVRDIEPLDESCKPMGCRACDLLGTHARTAQRGCMRLPSALALLHASGRHAFPPRALMWTTGGRRGSSARQPIKTFFYTPGGGRRAAPPAAPRRRLAARQRCRARGRRSRPGGTRRRAAQSRPPRPPP